MQKNIGFGMRDKKVVYPTYMKFEYLKKKVRMGKAKIREKIRIGQRLRHESVGLMNELYDAGYLDNAEDIYDYMNSISGKYGLEGKDETELSRFIKIIEYEMSLDCYNDDRDSIDYKKLANKELLACCKKLEGDLGLCNAVLSKMEQALFELTMLRDRLKKMQLEKKGLPELQINSKLGEEISDEYMYRCEER